MFFFNKLQEFVVFFEAEICDEEEQKRFAGMCERE
jgi:hypothetical protein